MLPLLGLPHGRMSFNSSCNGFEIVESNRSRVSVAAQGKLKEATSNSLVMLLFICSDSDSDGRR